MGAGMLLMVFCFLHFLCIPYLIVDGEIIPIDENATVQIANGKIRGRVEMSRFNRMYYAFKGIPYAKPPVGDLRFKAPVPPEPWYDILDARNDAPLCLQKNYLIYQIPPLEGEEDCLYINVYSPKLPSPVKKDGRKSKVLLPVMVFIHYGGFFSGGSSSDILGPEYFMDTDVVLVTFNYRLGVFGFLSTNNDAAPGNWAFKDQVAALRWVQENVESFGGDRDKVTIFGQSAGAGSVHHHILSPSSKGLFHAAITQSGSALSLWAKPFGEIQALVAAQQAVFVGCDPQVNSSELIECLRKVDATVLANSSDQFKNFAHEPLMIYGPVKEIQTDLNPEPFLTEDPLDIILGKRFHNVPWIIGIVKDEGILRSSPLVRQQNVLNELNKDLNLYGPQLFALQISVPQDIIKDVWNNISDFYIGSDTIDINKPETVQGFTDLYTDRSFIYGSYQSALLHAKMGHNQIWFYNFAYRGNYSYEEHFAATEETVPHEWGVSHSDDLLYLFSSSRFFPPLKAKNDILMSKIMIKLWTNFACYGNPTPEGTDVRSDQLVSNWFPLPNIEEEQVAKNEHLYYLNITGSYLSDEKPHLENANSFYPQRMRYWQSLPLYENVESIQ